MTTELPPQPSELPAATSLPPMPAAPPSRPRRPIGTFVAGVAIGAGLMGGTWAITANTGPAEPSTFTLKGEFTLLEEAVSIDGDCAGTGGYDDIREGASVTVYGAKGDVVATGSLGDSKSASYGTCTYKIAVGDVPKGEKFYKVEVSHRGTLQLTAKEAENGELASSLG
ncbi:hypothetical protein ACIRL3_44690 [Streptomyces sp. NPDC102384]|uniref:hypothetical protein n=1 Tax=Streptomyces sp. NPDC102384 TaxID=3366166 RepID=UPI0038076D8E